MAVPSLAFPACFPKVSRVQPLPYQTLTLFPRAVTSPTIYVTIREKLRAHTNTASRDHAPKPNPRPRPALTPISSRTAPIRPKFRTAPAHRLAVKCPTANPARNVRGRMRSGIPCWLWRCPRVTERAAKHSSLLRCSLSLFALCDSLRATFSPAPGNCNFLHWSHISMPLVDFVLRYLPLLQDFVDSTGHVI